MATPYRPGKIFEPPFRLNMTNLSQIFLQNNLALYILSNKNFFLPSLVTYRAVRDLISETKKFANSEDLRFANSEDFTFLMPCCNGCSEINRINRHLIFILLPLTLLKDRHNHHRHNKALEGPKGGPKGQRTPQGPMEARRASD